MGETSARSHLRPVMDGGDLVKVVSDICGIHAQVLSAAELSMAIRTSSIGRDEIREELWVRRSLVKTYGLLGTIHIFPSRELPLWMPALREITSLNDLGRKRSGTLDADRTQRIVDAIRDALQGSTLTRDELGHEIGRRVGAWAVEPTLPGFGKMLPAWHAALSGAAYAGKLCFGPNRGSRVTFTVPDASHHTGDQLDQQKALARVFRKYLSTYGPATLKQFCQWIGLANIQAAQFLTHPEYGALEDVDIEGTRALAVPEDSWPQGSARPSLHLLPHFDGYVIGCHPRSLLFGAPGAEAGLVHGVAGPVPVLLVDGVVAGIWELIRERREVRITAEPFVPLAEEHRAQLRAAAERIGMMLGIPASLEVGHVELRRHL